MAGRLGHGGVGGVGSTSLYLDIALMKLRYLREVNKTNNVALADPNIPTCCGNLGWDKKGRRKTQGKEIQLVGKDIEKAGAFYQCWCGWQMKMRSSGCQSLRR